MRSRDKLLTKLKSVNQLCSKRRSQKKISQDVIDVTLPLTNTNLENGKIHPISQVTEEIIEIFSDMGFNIAEGPDIEDEHHNFNSFKYTGKSSC